MTERHASLRRHLTRLHVRERHQAEPLGHPPDQLGFSDERDSLARSSEPQRQVAHENLGKRAQVGVDTQIDIMPWVVEADVHHALFDDQPPSLHSAQLFKFEIDHGPLSREVLGVDEPMNVPHQRAGVKFVTQQLAAHPALAPLACNMQERLELQAGLSRTVLPGTTTGGGDPLNHSRILQRFQPLGEGCRWNKWNAQTEIIEVPGARQQIPDDEQGPPLGQYLRSFCDRAVGAVSFHFNSLDHQAPISSSVFELDPAPAKALPWSPSQIDWRLVMSRYRKASSLALLVMFSGIFVGSARADVITDWNDVALEAVIAAREAQPTQARSVTMVHVAMFEAVNAIDRRYARYATKVAPASGASREVAAATAAHVVLTKLYPNQRAAFDKAYDTWIAQVPNDEAKASGIALGERVAQEIMICAHPK